MRQLKVFGGNYNGQYRVILAATSKTAFFRDSGAGPGYGCETANPVEVTTALVEPGVIFAMRYSDNVWHRVGLPAERFDGFRRIQKAEVK